jgi:curved DNA-binding protein CbpA
MERRSQTRTRKFSWQNLTISYRNKAGENQLMAARLLDLSESGMAIETGAALSIGSTISVVSSGGAEGRARIANCTVIDSRRFRVGLEFDGANDFYSKNRDKKEREANHPVNTESFVDFYEVLQLSPNADPDTVHRVYRLMAQRFHPDNAETGDEEAFKMVVKAYQVLSDPQQRAAYDVEHQAVRKVRWKIFDQPDAARGMQGEKRKRQGILGLLYAKRMNQPHQPSVSILEMEELLGCPREHLEFTLWYLKENGLAVRGDNGRFNITVKGVDEAESESHSAPWSAPDRLLTTSMQPPPRGAAGPFAQHGPVARA